MTYLDETANRVRAHLAPGVAVPDDSDELFLLYAVLARVAGTHVTNEDVHDAWVAWMASRGKHHGSMVPFDELPAHVRDEDAPFADAIRSAAAERPERRA